MKEPENSQPPWLTTKPGQPSAVTRPVTEEEIQAAIAARDRARAMTETPFGQSMMLAEDRFLDSARRNKESFAANLALYMGQPSSEENRARINTCREGLAKACRDLGEFVAALSVITDTLGRALSGFADLKKQILAWAAAVELPDYHRCACISPVVELTLPMTGSKVEGQLPHYSIAGMCYSHAHGKVVKVNRCDLCNCLNAFDGVPEEMVEIEAIRSGNHTLDVVTQRFSDAALLKHS